MVHVLWLFKHGRQPCQQGEVPFEFLFKQPSDAAEPTQQRLEHINNNTIITVYLQNMPVWSKPHEVMSEFSINKMLMKPPQANTACYTY